MDFITKLLSLTFTQAEEKYEEMGILLEQKHEASNNKSMPIIFFCWNKKKRGRLLKSKVMISSF